MNEQEHEKLEELIHGFLDGDLSERQRTELKRMAEHDPTLKKELHGLYRQKELLSALPVEKAPQGLAEEIRNKLERRMILASESSEEIRPIGHAHLFLRRIAAAAAMLLIPLCILAILVFQIMKPADEMPATGAPVARMNPVDEMVHLEKNIALESPQKSTALSLGRLTLVTDQPITVTDIIKNAVFDQHILPEASSNRTERGSTVYHIQGSQAQMLAFSEDLAAAWEQSSRQQLTVPVDDPAIGEVVIEGIRPDQMRILIAESNPVRLQMVASYMERQNKIDTADYLRNIRPESEGPDEVVLHPVEPKIAWNPERPDRVRSEEENKNQLSTDQSQVLLVIEVKRAMGE